MTKNVFITGGTSGVGKSLIYKFAKHGFNIFFTYFNNLNEARTISKNLKKYNIRNN
jgi:NAD(P)-dependent dehydrogenase (short-subunit alcohol dehydrogenase family)